VPTKQRTAEPELHYTQAEVAEICRVPPRRVRRWLDERRLGFVSLPQGRVVPVGDLAKFLASRHCPALGDEDQ